MSVNIITPRSAYIDLRDEDVITWEITEGTQVAFEIMYKFKSSEYWRTTGRIESNLARYSASLLFADLKIPFKEIYYKVKVFTMDETIIDSSKGQSSIDYIDYTSETHCIIFKSGYKYNTMNVWHDDEILEYPVFKNVPESVESIKVLEDKNDPNSIMHLPLVDEDSPIAGEVSTRTPNGNKSWAKEDGNFSNHVYSEPEASAHFYGLYQEKYASYRTGSRNDILNYSENYAYGYYTGVNANYAYNYAYGTRYDGYLEYQQSYIDSTRYIDSSYYVSGYNNSVRTGYSYNIQEYSYSNSYNIYYLDQSYQYSYTTQSSNIAYTCSTPIYYYAYYTKNFTYYNGIGYKYHDATAYVPVYRSSYYTYYGVTYVKSYRYTQIEASYNSRTGSILYTYTSTKTGYGKNYYSRTDVLYTSLSGYNSYNYTSNYSYYYLSSYSNSYTQEYAPGAYRYTTAYATVPGYQTYGYKDIYNSYTAYNNVYYTSTKYDTYYYTDNTMYTYEVPANTRYNTYAYKTLYKINQSYNYQYQYAYINSYTTQYTVGYDKSTYDGIGYKSVIDGYYYLSNSRLNTDSVTTYYGYSYYYGTNATGVNGYYYYLSSYYNYSTTGYGNYSYTVPGYISYARGKISGDYASKQYVTHPGSNGYTKTDVTYYNVFAYNKTVVTGTYTVCTHSSTYSYTATGSYTYTYRGTTGNYWYRKSYSGSGTGTYTYPAYGVNAAYTTVTRYATQAVYATASKYYTYTAGAYNASYGYMYYYVGDTNYYAQYIASRTEYTSGSYNYMTSSANYGKGTNYYNYYNTGLGPNYGYGSNTYYKNYYSYYYYNNASYGYESYNKYKYYAYNYQYNNYSYIQYSYIDSYSANYYNYNYNYVISSVNYRTTYNYYKEF